MIRPGHHRPLGTTTTMRFEWNNPTLPALGDVLQQISAPDIDDSDLVRRSYLIVGILEGRDRAHFRIVGERVEHGTVPADDGSILFFFNVPRAGRV